MITPNYKRCISPWKEQHREEKPLMIHYEFTEWSRVMFSALCIYKIHQISQSPLFTMVLDDLFLV